MLKKVTLALVFVLFVGLLVAGAVNRTLARGNTQSSTDHTPALDGSGNGRIAQAAPAAQNSTNVPAPVGNGQGRQRWNNAPAGDSAPVAPGNGRQGQQGLGVQDMDRDRAVDPTAHSELLTVTGTVVQAPAAGIDLIVATADGEVAIGTGPGYLDEQGFVVALGEEVEATGFWEDDEFKVVTLTRLTDGATIQLRDEWGRPYWSGAVRGNQSGQGGAGGQGIGQGSGYGRGGGRGANGGGAGNGGNGS